MKYFVLQDLGIDSTEKQKYFDLIQQGNTTDTVIKKTLKRCGGNQKNVFKRWKEISKKPKLHSSNLY